MNRRLWMRLAGVALSVLCLGYFVARSVSIWRTVGPSVSLYSLAAGIALAMPACLAGYFVFAAAWDVLLRGLGQTPTYLGSLGIYLTAQFGKYLPGNVGHLAGRVVLASRAGYPSRTVAASMALETALTVGVAGILGLPLAGQIAPHVFHAWQHSVEDRHFAFALLPLALFVTGAALALWLVAWRSATGKRSRAALAEISAELWTARMARWILPCLGLIVVGFGLSGAALLLVGLPRPTTWASQLPLVVGWFAVSWIAGSVTPGAPAGLGVRDAILVTGLAPVLGSAGSVTAAVLFRLLTSLGDLVAFGIGAFLLRRAARSSASVATSTPAGCG